jgi:hypothetical protein
MEDDTQAPPEDSGQVAEPVADEQVPDEVAAPPEPEQPPAEPLPRQPTPEEIEERAFQRTASWMGRRDNQLLNRISRVIDQKLAQQPPARAEAPSDPASMLDDPDGWARRVVPKIFDEEIHRRTQTEQRANAEIIRVAGSIMDSDPMFADKKFGAEVIKEIQGNFGKINKNLDPSIAAEMLVDRAVKNVYRRTLTAKASPLAGNVGKTGPTGTISPPATPAPKKEAVKLDPLAKKIAAWFGNTEDEVREMLTK